MKYSLTRYSGLQLVMQTWAGDFYASSSVVLIFLWIIFIIVILDSISFAPVTVYWASTPGQLLRRCTVRTAWFTLVAEHRFTSVEGQAPGLKPAAPTKLYGKMSSIPVVTISLPSCNGCVSPGTVCLNLLVKLMVLFSLLLIQDLYFCFPLADRHTTSLFGCSHQGGYFLARLTLSCTAGKMTKIIP